MEPEYPSVASQFKKFRFVVGGNGKPYSSRWSIWNHRRNVYVLSAPIGHAIKLSLHGDEGSLVCQLAHTQQYFEKIIAQLPDSGDRTIVRWRRKPTPEHGVLHVASIQFPTDYLRGSPVVGTTRKPLITFPPGDSGTMVEIGVFYSKISPEETEKHMERTSTPIGFFELPTGENVTIAGRIRKWGPPNLPSGEILKSGIKHPIQTRHWTEDQKREAAQISKQKNVTMVAFNQPADGGTLRIVEIGGVTLEKTDTSGDK